MLDATFVKSACVDLHNVFECVTETFPEMTLRGGPNGITFEGMDSSHVALMIYSIPAGSFEPGNFMCQRSTDIGLRSAAIRSIFKTIDKDTKSLTIRYDGTGSPHTLQILVQYTEFRMSEFSVLLSTLTPYTADTPIVEYSAEVRLPSNLLQRSCQDFRQFNDTITLTVGLQKDGQDLVMDSDNVSSFFSSDSEHILRYEKKKSAGEESCPNSWKYGDMMTEFRGQDGAFIEIGNEGDSGAGSYRFAAEEKDTKYNVTLGSADILSQLDQGIETSVETKVESVDITTKPKKETLSATVCISIIEPIGRLQFSLRFLSAFSRAQRCSKEVLLSLKQNNPCRLQYSAGDSGKLVFYLAPNASA